MKKIFKSNLTYLILMILINIACVLSLCFITGSKYSYPKSYQIDNSGAVAETILSRAYVINTGDVEVFEYFDANIEAYSDIIFKGVLNECNITSFSEVKTGEIIGKYNGNNVLAQYDGYCLNVAKENDNYNFEIYYYNRFSIKVTVTSNEYLYNKFSSEENYFLVIGTKKYLAKFMEYDLTYFYNQNKIYASFKLDSCSDLINEYTECQIARVKENRVGVTYVDAKAFDYKVGTKVFKILENNDYRDITLSTNEIIGDKAILAIDSYYSGKIIYE